MARTSLGVGGVLDLPGDKSISHRALIFAALATGRSQVRGLLQSEDVKATAGVLRALGWNVPAVGSAMTVDGTGFRAPLASPRSPLDCGNSGTTTRLMAGVAAAQPFVSTFVGDASLSRRPMRRVAAPLEAMGARVEFVEGSDGLPMTVHGGVLHTVAWELPVASAQLKSAILLAALCARIPVQVREPAPSRDHTERFLGALGASVTTTGNGVVFSPVDQLAPLDIDVPGDPSSAAFFVALAALANAGSLTLRRVLLNPARIGWIDAMARMGVHVGITQLPPPAAGGEPMGDLHVEPGLGCGTSIAPHEIPSLVDEIPMLAVLAARAEGETVVRGAEELRVKESDRISAVVSNLRAIGCDAEELPDGLIVRGTRAPLAGRVITHGDHRIAMAFAILGASRDCEITVDDAACVAVSYPAFWSDLADVTR